MWFRLGIQNFIAKKNVSDDSYELYISDFTQIWHTLLSNDELLSISQRLNPLFEASVQKLKEITSNLFQEEKAVKEISQENNSLTLKLKSNSLGIKFLFHIVLNKQNEEIFYNEFTLPLLFVLIQMKDREKELIKIIADKDAEIKEYKQECGPIKCNYVSTKPFNKEEFDNESNTQVCDISSLIECISATIAPLKKEQETCHEFSNKCSSSTQEKCITDTNTKIFKDNNTRIVGTKQCVKLQHQTIKRRKKQNDAFKIKF